MTKHMVSIATLLVITLIAALTLLFDTRESGHLTTFGYAVAILTVASFVLGIAAEIQTMREKAAEDADDRAKHLEQKHHLRRIETEVKATARPLLPLGMFYTLRHTITPHAAEAAFNGIQGFKTVQDNKFLRPVGSVQLGGPLRYNAVEQRAEDSHCSLTGQTLRDRLAARSAIGAIRDPVSITVEFFFPRGTVRGDPTLRLEKTFTTGEPDEVTRLELFDSTVFQDAFVHDWTAHTESGQVWSVDDLASSRIRVRFQFVGEHGPIDLHNLHLLFGPRSAMHGIAFSSEALAKAVFKDDEHPVLHPQNDLAREFFAPYVLEFESLLSQPLLADHLVTVV